MSHHFRKVSVIGLLVVGTVAGTIYQVNASKRDVLGEKRFLKRTTAKVASDTDRPTPLVAPLFLVTPRFTSVLGMVNGSALSTFADVVVRDEGGNQIATTRVSFAPHSPQQVDIGILLKSVGSAARTGSILVIQDPSLKGPAILSSLSLTYQTSLETVFVDEELIRIPASNTETLRGVGNPGSFPPMIAVTSL